MRFALRFTGEARDHLKALESDADKKDLDKLAKVRACLGKLQSNPKHPGLNSHEYEELTGEKGVKVWESYVENKTPAAWRVFWHYGPGRGIITVVAITPHP